jgi:transcriptional regulator with PAS, ATPase and Fis domain
MEICIGLIAPYKQMIPIALELAKGRGIRLSACVALLHDVVDHARKMESEGVNVVMVREVTDAYLRDCIRIPIVPIRMSGTDILRALLKAKKMSKKIALANFRGVYQDLDLIKEAADCSVREFVFSSREEGRAKIEALRGYVDVIVGGGLTTQIAEALGFRSVLIETSPKWIGDALDIACDVAKANWEEKRKRKQVGTIVNLVPMGIIAVDQDRKFTLYNQAAERILDIPSGDVVGLRNSHLLQKTGLTVIMDEARSFERTVSFGNKSVFSHAVPIIINNQVFGGVAILHEVARVEEMDRNIRMSLYLKGHAAKYNFSDILGVSKVIKETIYKARKLANSDFTILITGETGTGKELFAHSIFNQSQRNGRPFVAINCASIPETLLEAELFGYEEGSFTGAKKGGKKGYFELAHGGAIFLDEVGTLPLGLQTRLLRVINEKELIRIGGQRVIPIDVRIIASTNASLLDMVNHGDFREDLYYRLNVLNLQIPPLRERLNDIPIISAHVLGEYGISEPNIEVINSALQFLVGYPWPGNVRELKNILAQLVVLFSDRKCISYELVLQMLKEMRLLRHQNDRKGSSRNRGNLKLVEASRNAERESIERLLSLKNHSMAEIALMLGVSRTTLWRKCRDLDLNL